MNDFDRRVIEQLQDHFPLEVRPYETMAARLGISADRLWQRVRSWVESGMIRRIGFSLDSRKIGCCSTLAAVKVPPQRIEEASSLMMDIPQITHNYLREDVFNLWFTIIAESREQIAAILERIRTTLELPPEDVLDLPVEKLFKLDARFKGTV